MRVSSHSGDVEGEGGFDVCGESGRDESMNASAKLWMI